MAHLDRASSFGFPSSDPQLDDKIFGQRDETKRKGTSFASDQGRSDLSQMGIGYSVVAPVSAQETKIAMRLVEAGLAADQSISISPENKRQQSHGILVPSKRKKRKLSAANQSSCGSSQVQSQRNHAVTDPAQVKTTKKARVPRIVKELFPHNEGPPIGIHPSIGVQTPPEDSNDEQTRVRVTRDLVRGHCKRINNKPETPRKSLNVRQMMRDQLQGEGAVKGEKIQVGSPASSKVDSSPSQSRSQTFQPFSICDNMPMSRRFEDYDVSLSWKRWEENKARTNNYLRGHSISNPNRGTMRLRDFDRILSSRDVDFAIDDEGIYVFKPTVWQYSCFTELLALTEEAVGCSQGVAKVIVPEACITAYQENHLRPNILVDFEVPIYKTTLSQGPSAKRANLYAVDTKRVGTQPAKVTKLLEHIQEEEALYLANFKGASLKGDSVWRQRQETKAFTESNMMECVADSESTKPWCVPDASATPELREALECDNIHLAEQKSNGFLQSATIQAGEAGPGLGHSSFHLSTRSGTIFPMQLGDFAAYTLNYHHAGGPRTYTIVKPSSHQRLEEFICLAFQQTSKSPRPPACAQFVSHEVVYIPKETLIANGIEFTEVNQFERELLIIFPYAYYQGFNGAANIVEEVMYASKRWEVFHRERLYTKCSKYCADGEDEFDLSFAEMEEDDPDEDYDIRPPASKRRHKEE